MPLLTPLDEAGPLKSKPRECPKAPMLAAAEAAEHRLNLRPDLLMRIDRHALPMPPSTRLVPVPHSTYTTALSGVVATAHSAVYCR